jgi:hypothetical protein
MPVLIYEEVRKKPAVFLAMTSLNGAEFDELLIYFRNAWDRLHPRDQKNRGRPPEVKRDEDRLFFILFYYKTYPLQEVLGHLFGVSQERACELVSEYTEALKEALLLAGEAPTRNAESLKKILQVMLSRTTSSTEQSGVSSGLKTTKDSSSSTAASERPILLKITSLLAQRAEESNT